MKSVRLFFTQEVFGVKIVSSREERKKKNCIFLFGERGRGIQVRANYSGGGGGGRRAGESSLTIFDRVLPAPVGNKSMNRSGSGVSGEEGRLRLWQEEREKGSWWWRKLIGMMDDVSSDGKSWLERKKGPLLSSRMPPLLV